ncbi:C6 transcription factor Prf [Ceratobasidium theobromae]|uniref:C6 transcription factor Prf n=1 Tax=Ceratobasidium theobromae TaxID=1582974 RepID=A0A5N5QLU7_9AGAM|nr:C6 transcription factor Prf [Ceratobasidium theobromae]
MDEAETTTRRQSKRPAVPPSTHNLRDLREIPRSCQSCRKFKLRCSGEKPQCVVCTQKGILCEYDDPPRQSTRVAAIASGGATARKRPAPTSSYAQIKESRQRKRAAAAATSCDFCRNDLRRKCDGLRPSCQSCIKRGMTCVYSGPASIPTPTSATSSAPLAPQPPSKALTVSDNEIDSDVPMHSRSGSPDISLVDVAKEDPRPRYPQGNGLGHPGSTRNPDGTNCTRPVACYFCIHVEITCTGDFPTCVNCIRRNRVCTYPDPKTYEGQFPKESALHSRQNREPERGSNSPGKAPLVLTSPGRPPARGVLDPSRGVLDARGALDPPGPSRGVLDPPSSLRGILDPPGASRGVLDTPGPPRGVLDPPSRGTLDTTRGILDPGAPRSALEPPRGVLDAPQPTLHTSRSLPGPLNQPRINNQMTPTPPSMSVSPDPSVGTSVHTISTEKNDATKTVGSGPSNIGAAGPDQNGIGANNPPRVTTNGTGASHSWQRPGTEGDSKSSSNIEPRTWANADGRAPTRTGSGADTSRTPLNIDPLRPSQTQHPRSDLPNASDRRNTAPASTMSSNESDRRNGAGPSDPRRDASRERPSSTLPPGGPNLPNKPNSDPRTISGLLTENRPLVGGPSASTSSRPQDGATAMRERSGSGSHTQPQPQSQKEPPREQYNRSNAFPNDNPYRARHGQGEGPLPSRSGSGNVGRSNQSSPRSPNFSMAGPPMQQPQPLPPTQFPSQHQHQHQRRDSFTEQGRGPPPDHRNRSDSRGGGLGAVHVSNAGSPRRGSGGYDSRGGPPPSASRPPPSMYPSQRPGPSGRYGDVHPDARRDSFSDTRRDSFSDTRRDSFSDTRRDSYDPRRDYPPEPRREHPRRDSAPNSRYDPGPPRQRHNSMTNECDRSDSRMSDRDRDDRRTLPPPGWTQQQQPSRLPARPPPVEIQPEILPATNDRSQIPAASKKGSPAGGTSTPLRPRTDSGTNSPSRGVYRRAESGSIRSSPMDMDSS